MSCAITSGYTFPCRINQGGIKAVYIGTFNGTAETFTFGTATQSGEITAFGGATVSMYTVTNRQEQGSMTFTPVIAANGCVSYDHTIEVVIEGVDNILSNWIQVLHQGIWRIMVLDALGNYWMCGISNGAYTISGPGGAGKAIGDGNKVTLTFQAKEPSMPALVSSTAALTVIV
jgi:hypothetical protein